MKNKKQSAVEEMAELFSGKKPKNKEKQYVDDAEYEKLTGKKPEYDNDDEEMEMSGDEGFSEEEAMESPEEESKEEEMMKMKKKGKDMRPGLFGKTPTIMIAIHHGQGKNRSKLTN